MTRIDLDAARAEAAGETHEVVLGGEAFTVPPVEDWPLDAVDRLQSGQFAQALESVLDGQWERFAAHRPTLRDLRTITEGIVSAQGLGDTGKPSRSSGSSKSTGRR